MRSLLSICLMLIGLLPNRQIAAQASDARDSLVYVAVLDSMFGRSIARNIRQLVVRDTTFIFRQDGSVGRWLIDRLYQLSHAESATDDGSAGVRQLRRWLPRPAPTGSR